MTETHDTDVCVMVCVPKFFEWITVLYTHSQNLIKLWGAVVTVLDTAVHDKGDHLMLCEQHA